MYTLTASEKFNTYYNKAVLLLVFTIPLSQYISAKLLVIICILAIFTAGFQGNFLQFFRNSWDISLYLIILIIGLVYSENVSSGLRVLETNLSLIAIPFAFSQLSKVEENKVNQIFYSFAFGLYLACLICLGTAVLMYSRTGNTDVFFFYSLTDVLRFQPTYFAYYLIFVITYQLYLFYYQKGVNHLVAKSIGIVFLFFVLMLTGGHTAFVSMLLIFAFFILKFLIEEKNKIKRLAIGLVVLMLVGMFLTTMIANGNRATLPSDSWDRLALWESAINAVPNPLFGVGTGDYKTVLNQYYTAHGMVMFANESYNSHNQFIQLLFSNGFLGVIALLIMLARPLYLSFNSENILAILSLFPFLIYGITEVFLGRYQGVVFFAFIHQLFIIQLNSKKPSILLKPSLILR